MSPAGRPRGRRMAFAAAVVIVAAATLDSARADNDPATGPAAGPRRVLAPVGEARPARSGTVWLTAVQAPAPIGFPALLEARLAREAERRGAAPPSLAEPDDDQASRGRAERIFTRALRGALDEHLETLARETPGIGAALRFLDGFGTRREPEMSRVAAPAAGDSAAIGLAAFAPPRPRDPFAAGLRFRLDAHPRLEMRARAGTITGLVEIPLLEREVRVGLEQPLGRFGRAALRGGRSGDRGDWADFTLALRF